MSNIRCVLIFCTTFAWNISHWKKNSTRYTHSLTWVCVHSSRHPCRVLFKLDFLDRFYKTHHTSNFVKNPSNGSRVVPYGQPGKQTWRRYCANFANAPFEKNEFVVSKCQSGFCREFCQLSVGKAPPFSVSVRTGTRKEFVSHIVWVKNVKLVQSSNSLRCLCTLSWC